MEDRNVDAAPVVGAAQPNTDPLFPRDGSRRYPTVVGGSGIRFWDEDGKTYIDGDSGAISVSSVGHGVTEVAEAMAEQAGRLAYAQFLRFYNVAARELAAHLREIAPMPDARALFVQSGSDATETAVKLARHYHYVRGDRDRHVVITRKRSYHGATVGALSLSGTPARKTPYLPLLPFEPLLAEQYCYRCPFGQEYPSCGLACADDLTRVIEETGPEKVAAVLVEPIVAAAGPGLTPPPGYFTRLREICDRHGILLMVDEVVTGFGRTGKMFGIQHWDVEPDVVTMAKGMAGGYVPLGGLLVGGHVSRAFVESGQAFTHGFTFDAHPVACAAASKVLEIIERDGLVANAASQGARLHAGVKRIAERHPVIGDVRGKGLLCGVELVEDRATRRPFAAEKQITKRVCRAAEDNGLMIYAGVGSDGNAGDVFVISPPLVINESEVNEVLEKFESAVARIEDEEGIEHGG